MPATNRYRNFTATWTPSGGSATPVTGLKSFAYDEGNETLMESADADAFHTVGGVILSSPKITLETIDAMALYATIAGTKGTLAVTLRDHTNGATASGGAKTFTMSNAFLGPRSIDGKHNALASQNLVFMSTSTDGSTHPVAVTAL